MMLALLYLLAFSSKKLPQTIPLPPPTHYSITTSSDTRLNAQCELHCKGVMLRDVLKELEAQTKVRIVVKGQWIGDLRATIFTKPMPLRTMLVRMASLFHLSWKAEGDSPNEATYSLYESPIDKRYAQDIADTGWKSVMASIRKGREYASLSSEELNKRAARGDTMAQALLRHDGERDKLNLFWGLDDASYEKLRDRRPLHFRYDQLPTDLQSCLLRIQQSNIAENERSIALARQENPDVPAYIAPKYETADLRLRYLLNGEGGAVQLYALVEANKSGFSAYYPLINVNSTNLWHQTLFNSTQLRLPANKRAINRKMREDISVSAKSWGDTAEQLHQKTGLNIFSDAYNGPSSYMDNAQVAQFHSFDEGTKLESVLQIGDSWSRNWWQEGASGNDVMYCFSWWYLVHKPNNYEALKQRIQQKRKRKERLSLEDVAEGASLPGTMMSWLEDTTNTDLFLAQVSAGVFRLYNSLSVSERRLLLTSGLKKAVLTSSLWSSFQDILDDMHYSLTENQKQSAILILECEGSTSSFSVKWLKDASGTWEQEQILHIAALPSFLKRVKDQ